MKLTLNLFFFAMIFCAVLIRKGASFTTSRINTSAVRRGFATDSRRAFLFQHDYARNQSLSKKLRVSLSAATEDELESYKNKNNIDDQLVAFISENGEMKVTACTIRNIVNDVMLQQTLTPTPADALARSMACGILLSNGMQAEQTFQLTLQCDGPIRSVMCITNGKGETRGYVGNPGLADMHISEAIGRGSVQVVKMHPSWPTPYNGITAIEHGDVDRDVGIYLAESEQRACALAAASKYSGILCTAAGGYIVEQLPGCSKETAKKVEENLAKLTEADGSNTLPAGLLLSGKTPLDICSIVLDGLGMTPLQNLEPKLVCDCNEDRLFRAISLLPREEVEKILAEEEKIEARCHFCGKVYRMGPEDVKTRLDNVTGDPSLDEDFNKNN